MNVIKIGVQAAVAVAILSCFSTVNAQSLNISEGSMSTNGGNVAITIDFVPDPAVHVADYSTIMNYSTAQSLLTGNPTVTNGNAACVLDIANTEVMVIRSATMGSPPPAVGPETACTISFTIAAGATVGVYPLTHRATSMGDETSNPVPTAVFNDGAINIVAEGPPTITFPAGPFVLPPAGFGMSTNTTIPVTVTDGGGNNPANTASYTCTAPAGFTVSPLAGGPIANGGTLADLDVSCTTGAAAVNGNISCTATNTTPSSVNFTIPVTCPAGTMAAPNLTPTPAAGGTVTVGAGAPGATACGTISIAASGGAGTDEATVTCTSGDAAVTVTPAGPLTFGVGDAPQTIQVCTTLTDTAQTFTDVITCTGDDGNGSIDWAPFSVAAAAGSTAPRFVPASSLWSKLALFGIFGALGMLIIGLRRSH